MDKKLTNNVGAPVVDNQNAITAGPRGPMLLQDAWFLEKLAHFDREVIPERRMHAKGSGAYGTFTVTHDITKYTKAKIFSEVGKKTELFLRFSTVAGERGAADAERDIRGVAMKFYTEEGNWDLVGNNTPVFFLKDPLKFPDLNHAVKRDPKTNMRSARNNWDFWTSLPESLHQVTITMSERGIPYSYRHMNAYGTARDYVQRREMTLEERLADLGNPTLVIEPGRSLMASAGITLTEVMGVKDVLGHPVVSLDMGINNHGTNLISPDIFPAAVLPRHASDQPVDAFLAGRLCFSGDSSSGLSPRRHQPTFR